MSYFTAVLVRDGDKWFARDVNLDDVEDLGELTDTLRAIEVDDQPILMFIEREDAWWSVIRVDGDEDPRVFVSDVGGAAASPYAALLDIDADPLADPDDDAPVEGVGGDTDVLADLGTPPGDLLQLCEDELIPMDALATVAEAGGFAEVLDSLR